MNKTISAILGLLIVINSFFGITPIFASANGPAVPSATINTIKTQEKIEQAKNIAIAKKYNLTETQFNKLLDSMDFTNPIVAKIFTDKMNSDYNKTVQKQKELQIANDSKGISAAARTTTNDELSQINARLQQTTKAEISVKTNQVTAARVTLNLPAGMKQVTTVDDGVNGCNRGAHPLPVASYFPGDLLITRESAPYPSPFSRLGYTGHAGIVVNSLQSSEARNTDPNGNKILSNIFPLSDWCYKKSFTSIGWVTPWNAEKSRTAANNAATWLTNRKYPDGAYGIITTSLWDISSVYCSKLPWRAYAGSGIDIGARGTNIVTPSSIFYDANTLFIYAWVQGG